jgi:hypothetical protein
MKWPEGYHRPALLRRGLDDEPGVLASYIHPDEVREHPEITDEIIRDRAAQGKLGRGVADAARAVRGGVIRERSLFGQDLLRRNQRLVSTLGVDPAKVARRAEIIHSVHEQRHGVPKSIGRVLKSEWASNAATFIGRKGSQGFKPAKLPGTVAARTARAAIHTAAAAIESLVRHR